MLLLLSVLDQKSSQKTLNRVDYIAAEGSKPQLYAYCPSLPQDKNKMEGRKLFFFQTTDF